MDKVVRDGLVAVLYSPGFGAGWSTWADEDDRNVLLFHPRLVALAEQQDRSEAAVLAVLNDVLPNHSVYLGGWEDIEVAWLPEGTRFLIAEYDGSESIRFADGINWQVA